MTPAIGNVKFRREPVLHYRNMYAIDTADVGVPFDFGLEYGYALKIEPNLRSVRNLFKLFREFDCSRHSSVSSLQLNREATIALPQQQPSLIGVYNLSFPGSVLVGRDSHRGTMQCRK